MGIEFLATGAGLPEKVLTNAELEKIVDTTDQWITERTGIKERRVAGKGVQGVILNAETLPAPAITAAYARQLDRRRPEVTRILRRASGVAEERPGPGVDLHQEHRRELASARAVLHVQHRARMARGEPDEVA